MSAPQPPTAAPDPSSTASYESATRTLSYTLLVACPILLVLPPRKLDFYTFSLGTAWVASANHIVRDRSGKGILQQVDAFRWQGLPTEKARDVQERLAREKLLRAQPSGQGMEVAGAESLKPSPSDPLAAQSNRDEDTGIKGIGKKLWMGGQGEGWKEQRLKEEREALANGKGYQGLIMDQIWEVWNWDKKKKGDDGNRGGQGKEGSSR